MSDDSRLRDVSQPSSVAAFTWLVAGVACSLVAVLGVAGNQVRVGPTVFVYGVTVLLLDLLVGSSRSQVVPQRVTPAVVLALLILPGHAPGVAVLVNLIATILVALVARVDYLGIAHCGRALVPAAVTAIYLQSGVELTSESYFFACELFVVASLLTRTPRPPFRSDIFLVVCYPAVALMLGYLSQLGGGYVLLALPLLFLLTTVDTDTLLAYFQLRKKLDESRTEIRQTRQAQRQSELESRRKGIMLVRKEKQLSLLNGLGRQMEAARAAEDLGRFLLDESLRLTGADGGLVILGDPSGRVAAVLSEDSGRDWGLAQGEPLPASLEAGISPTEPWPCPLWSGGRSFLTCRLGNQGWLFLSRDEAGVFPEFLQDFFSAVGRHAGSAMLALRRLSEVQATALREAQEKQKVADQNRNLRLLLESFEALAAGSLASDQELLARAGDALRQMTGAERVLFGARPLDVYPLQGSELVVNERRWPSHFFRAGEGPSGNLLCLSQRTDAFHESQHEWCILLQDFLDQTLEINSLHRDLQLSYQQLKRTQQEVVLSSQWAAAGRLAANAAHELNTPLGAIRIAAEHIDMHLHHGGDPQPAIESMESLMRSIARCQRVTDRLLITSRPADKGSDAATPQAHSFDLILADALASVQPFLRASKIQLDKPEPLPDHQVMVVMRDLYWALVYVLKNAIDALSEENTPDKRIAIRLASNQRELSITVQDNGPGVPPEVKPRLFEAFFTTKKLGQGNGLGLSLSRTNMARWGGQIDYQDTEGRGATFVVKVPLARG
ncbi:MAG: sensor histidine kinase [Vulcanimicrobiota bacterium]